MLCHRTAMMKFPPPPSSIREVAEAILAYRDDVSATKEFIDSLIRIVLTAGGTRPDGILPIPADTYADEPPFIENDVRRVYLAGLAEHLALLSGQKPPEWCFKAVYSAPEAIFRGNPKRMEAVKAASPPAFVRRNLLCGPVLVKLTTFLDLHAVA